MKKIILITVTICFASFLWVSCSHEKSTSAENKSAAGNYSLYKIKESSLESTLRLPAQLNPYQEVAIYPRITGYVKSVPVDIGTLVKQGETLMELEAPDIEQNTISAHEKYLNAQSAYNASRDTYSRLVKTSETKGAVSQGDLQAAQSKMQSDSAMSNSEKAGWMAKESMKNYLVVKAPFDGTITQRNIDAGALVVVGNKNEMKPMLQLQQISKLRLLVSVPETFATQLQNNKGIKFTVEALPGRTFSGTISRSANSLDPKFRSESVQIDVLNNDNTLMAGMYAEVLLPLNGHANACVVPQSAVVTSTEKKYIIKVENNKNVFVNVITGNENNGMIEIFGDVKTGDSIIAKASEEIK